MYKVKWMYSAIAVLVACVGVFFLWKHSHQPANQSNWNALAQSSEQKRDPTTNQSKDQSEQKSENHTDSEAPKSIMVDIEGEVKKPGVFTLSSEARIIDVVKQAGGLKADADKKRINLAKRVTDEMLIYIPRQGEEDGTVSTANADPSEETSGATGQEKININTADLTKLEGIPGIGATKAQAIIDYRSKSGPFKSVDDLLNVTGIGEKSLEKMKAVVTVG
ncbi:competence protein CelA [Pullulanibacillus camelliae]|uniref:Competence protein CelA n=1 Tax=Pullulanibacillus camelliae TaxID=1707096 RepID=A0A8J2YHS7_9BACL|nr:helix-hairpin-helix domain-containing protein [Pullulanibacillus camelliae]GGE43399.1 competence protein CelA [Pullulanibacillus camelliae]